MANKRFKKLGFCAASLFCIIGADAACAFDDGVHASTIAVAADPFSASPYEARRAKLRQLQQDEIAAESGQKPAGGMVPLLAEPVIAQAEPEPRVPLKVVIPNVQTAQMQPPHVSVTLAKTDTPAPPKNLTADADATSTAPGGNVMQNHIVASIVHMVPSPIRQTFASRETPLAPPMPVTPEPSVSASAELVTPTVSVPVTPPAALDELASNTPTSSVDDFNIHRKVLHATPPEPIKMPAPPVELTAERLADLMPAAGGEVAPLIPTPDDANNAPLPSPQLLNPVPAAPAVAAANTVEVITPPAAAPPGTSGMVVVGNGAPAPAQAPGNPAVNRPVIVAPSPPTVVVSTPPALTPLVAPAPVAPTQVNPAPNVPPALNVAATPPAALDAIVNNNPDAGAKTDSNPVVAAAQPSKQPAAVINPSAAASAAKNATAEALADASKQSDAITAEAEATGEPPRNLSPESKSLIAKIPSGMDRAKKPSTEKLAISHGRDTDYLAQQQEVVTNRPADGMNIKIEAKTRQANVNYQLEQAYNALNIGNSENAIEIYKNVLTADPNNKNALFSLAATYHRAGQIDKARPLYARLLTIDPGNRDAINNFMVLLADEAPEEALSQLDKLEARNPSFSPIPAQMAVIYQKLGDNDRATEKMFKAIMLAPENLTYRYNLAIMMDKQHNYEEAGKLYDQILQANQRGEVTPGNIDKIQERLTFIRSNRS